MDLRCQTCKQCVLTVESVRCPVYLCPVVLGSMLPPPDLHFATTFAVQCPQQLPLGPLRHVLPVHSSSVLSGNNGGVLVVSTSAVIGLGSVISHVGVDIGYVVSVESEGSHCTWKPVHVLSTRSAQVPRYVHAQALAAQVTASPRALSSPLSKGSTLATLCNSYGCPLMSVSLGNEPIEPSPHL